VSAADTHNATPRRAVASTHCTGGLLISCLVHRQRNRHDRLAQLAISPAQLCLSLGVIALSPHRRYAAFFSVVWPYYAHWPHYAASCLSVRPSVCLPVCLIRVLNSKTKKSVGKTGTNVLRTGVTDVHIFSLNV